MEVFQQACILFIFLAVGFLLGKLKVVKQEHSQILSKLIVNFFLPCMIAVTFSRNFTVEYMSANYTYLVASVIILAVTGVGGFFIGRLLSKHDYERKVLEYSVPITNISYFGFALTESLMGEVGLMRIMVFTIPAYFYMYIYGMAILTKQKMTLKSLLSPVVLSMAVGIVLGLTGLQLPLVVTDVMDKSKACVGPVSMLLSGIAISEYKFRDVLGNKLVYIMSAIRLLVIPIVLGFVLKGLVAPEVMLIAVLYHAMPCGLNTVVFPKLVNEDCRLGAGLAIISSALACLTIPLVFWIFGF